jgi:malate dehydrogenase (oxaloacetate-decarboxylating)
MTDLRFVSAAVALAVANAAVEQGFARVELHDPIEQVQQAMWHPEYPRIVPCRAEPCSGVRGGLESGEAYRVS